MAISGCFLGRIIQKYGSIGATLPKDVCQSQEDIDAWIEIQMYQMQNNHSDESGVKISSCLEQAGFGEYWPGLFLRVWDCLSN